MSWADKPRARDCDLGQSQADIGLGQRMKGGSWTVRSSCEIIGMSQLVAVQPCQKDKSGGRERTLLSREDRSESEGEVAVGTCVSIWTRVWTGPP